MTSISKNVYIDKLHDIVIKYNNTYHGTIKIKPVDVKSSTCINYSQEINDKDPKFKIGNIGRISSYKNIFANDYVPKFFVIKNVKNTVPWKYVISIFKGKEIAGTFYEKELQRKKNKKKSKIVQS